MQQQADKLSIIINLFNIFTSLSIKDDTESISIKLNNTEINTLLSESKYYSEFAAASNCDEKNLKNWTCNYYCNPKHLNVFQPIIY